MTEDKMDGITDSMDMGLGNYTLQYLPMRVLIEGRGEGDDRG